MIYFIAPLAVALATVATTIIISLIPAKRKRQEEPAGQGWAIIDHEFIEF